MGGGIKRLSTVMERFLGSIKFIKRGRGKYLNNGRKFKWVEEELGFVD